MAVLTSSNNPITADGDYQLPKLQSGALIVVSVGGAGTAGTVKIQWSNGADTPLYFDYVVDGSALSYDSDGTTISAPPVPIVVPPSGVVNINVSSLAGGNLLVQYAYVVEEKHRRNRPEIS